MPSLTTIQAIFTNINTKTDIQRDFQIKLNNVAQALNLAVYLISFIGEQVLLETKMISLARQGPNMDSWMLNALTRLWLVLSDKCMRIIDTGRSSNNFGMLSKTSRKLLIILTKEKVESNLVRRSAVLLSQITCRFLFLEYMPHVLEQEVCLNLVIFISAWRLSASTQAILAESILPALFNFSEDESRLRQCGSDLKVDF